MLLPWFSGLFSRDNGKIIYAQPHQPIPIAPAPMIKIAAIKLMKPLQMPDVEALQPLEPVWEDKRRPQGTYANSYAPGNCTWYVASRLPVPQNWGNANTWDDSARAAGYTVTAVPKVGEVAQSDAMSYLGHVALVEAIDTVAGTVTVSEMNVQGLGITDTSIYPISAWVYIYV